MSENKRLEDLNKYRRTTQLDFALEALKYAVLNGELNMGDRVNEVAITNQLGISRTTFREALRQMEESGIFVREPFKGTFVRKFTEKEIREINDLQGVLECRAVQLILEKGKNSPEDLQGLYSIIDEMEQIDPETQEAERNRLHIDFHKCLVKISGHSFLYRVWQDLSMQFQMAMAVSQDIFKKSGETANFAKAHREIADAVRLGNCEEAEKLIHKHVTNSYSI